VLTSFLGHGDRCSDFGLTIRPVQLSGATSFWGFSRWALTAASTADDAPFASVDVSNFGSPAAITFNMTAAANSFSMSALLTGAAESPAMLNTETHNTQTGRVFFFLSGKPRFMGGTV
jgi:hypothetical protein